MENKVEQKMRENREKCARNKHCVNGVSMLYFDEDCCICRICGAKYPSVFDSEDVDKALKFFNTLKDSLATDPKSLIQQERTIEEKLDGLEDTLYCDLEKILKYNGYEEITTGRFQKGTSLAEIVRGKEKAYAIHIL